MLEPLRWTTVHPALVHFPLALLPVAAVAFALAARRRSARWTFVADVVLGVAAAGALAAAAFGLVSFLVLHWPGGLGPWPLVHPVLGATVAASSLALAVARRGARRQAEVAGPGWAVATGLVTLVVFVTGWVGAEVLVFHQGMAVKAAGDGAFAPPVSWSRRPPATVLEAMGRLRAAWGGASTALAESVVDHPTSARYQAIAQEARHLREVAEWVATQGGPATPPQEEGVGGTGDPLTDLALLLSTRAQALQHAAEAEDLPGTAAALGEVERTCATCHLQLRWAAPAPLTPPAGR